MSPEREKTYQGLQGLDITSARDLFYPKRAFAIANMLNEGVADNNARVGIEVYPTFPIKFLAVARTFGEKLGLPILPPPRLDQKYIKRLLDQFPDAHVTRVHLEFNYNWHEQFHRIFIGERKNGPMHMAYQVAWALLFKPAIVMEGLRLARELEVGVNAHTNVIEGFYKDQRIAALHQVSPVLAENERPFSSPIQTDISLISDPVTIAQDYVETRHLAQGILLALDHKSEDLTTFRKILQNPLIREHTWAMHLADPSRGIHGVIETDDIRISALLEEISQTKFAHPVRAALNYVTKFTKNGSLAQQADFLRKTIDWIMETQSL